MDKVDIGVPWGMKEKEAYRDKIEAELVRLKPLLPEIDPRDLLQILACIYRPFGTGRKFFLHKLPEGSGRVF